MLKVGGWVTGVLVFSVVWKRVLGFVAVRSSSLGFSLGLRSGISGIFSRRFSIFICLFSVFSRRFSVVVFIRSFLVVLVIGFTVEVVVSVVWVIVVRFVLVIVRSFFNVRFNRFSRVAVSLDSGFGIFGMMMAGGLWRGDDGNSGRDCCFWLVVLEFL